MSGELAMLDIQRMVDLAKLMKHAVLQIRQSVLVEGVDYGTVPGTDKPTLLKPGAERLCSSFELYPELEMLPNSIENWDGGFFYYHYRCTLRHRITGHIFGIGEGSCNSREKKYGWRWVSDADLPPGTDTATLLKRDARRTLFEFEFAIDLAKTDGPYGKPAEYWQQFREAIASGAATPRTRPTKNGEKRGYEIMVGMVEYRLPNPDIFDQVNTIKKMAQKRGLIAATLVATNASAFFTQDLEDFHDIQPVQISSYAPQSSPAPLPELPGMIAVSPPVPPVVTVPPAPVLVTTDSHWSKDPDNVAKLVAKARRENIIAPDGTATSLLHLLNVSDWLSYKTGQEAWRALEAFALPPARPPVTPPPPPPAPLVTRNLRHRLTEMGYDGKQVTLSTPHGDLTTSRQKIRYMLETTPDGNAWYDLTRIGTWADITPTVHTVPPVEIIYDLTESGGVKTLELAVMTAEPLPVLAGALEADNIPF